MAARQVHLVFGVWLAVAAVASACGSGADPIDAAAPVAPLATSDGAGPSEPPVTSTVGDVTHTATVRDVVDEAAQSGEGLSVVPDVVGIPILEAMSAVVDAGLVPWAIGQVHGAGPASLVLAASAEPGTKAAAGTVIELVVSTPPTVAAATDGDLLVGVLNAAQSDPLPGAESWSLLAFLDENLTYFGAREVLVLFPPGDVRCASGAPVESFEGLTAGTDIEFYLVHDAANEIASMAPSPLRATSVSIDC